MPCGRKSNIDPQVEQKIIDVLSQGEFKSGEIAEKLWIDKKEVDKVIKKLKQEWKIISPKRCYYTVAK